MKQILAFALILTSFVAFVPAQTAPRRAVSRDLPAGYWSLDKTQPLLEKVQTIRLAPNLTNLSADERSAITKLNEVGRIFQDLYELQRHPQSVSARKALEQLDRRTGSTTATQNLLTLYRLNSGPVGSTLEGKREPFVPAELAPAAGGMYPADSTKAELDAFLAANPEMRDSILGSRTAVRRTTAANLQRDLAKLRQYPVLDTLHPGLKTNLQRMRPNAKAFYAVPY
ncbi:MAG TPA: hypothetical protein VEX64_04160, partial [Pyrinomonadaceae bacterium]|nr:hypothetical protein [Pyrinomonadaceae bacterium]